MFRSDLLKLSVTLVLLAVTAFASVTAVAAEGSGTIRLVKAASASAALGGTADTSDWYGRHPSPVKAGDAADLSDYFQRVPGSIRSTQYFRLVAVNAADLSDYFQRHPSSTLSGDAAGSLMYYGPPGR